MLKKFKIQTWNNMNFETNYLVFLLAFESLNALEINQKPFESTILMFAIVNVVILGL